MKTYRPAVKPKDIETSNQRTDNQKTDEQSNGHTDRHKVR